MSDEATTGSSDGGNESAATGVPEAGATDRNVPEVDSAPDVEAGPSQPLSCTGTSSPWQGIDTATCNPIGNRGCAAGQACAIVAPTAAGCVPSNLAARNTGAGGQGYPCGTQYGCADGTICNQNQVCGTYCCSIADCAATGFAGLHCVALQYAGDAGIGDGSASGRFGVCQ